MAMAMERRIWVRLLAIALELAHWWAAAEASHVVYESLQSVPAAVVSSELRPGFHFQSPRNWLNDPNGPMFYNGLYHLFYQYNPKGSVWGNIVWAHSVSTDLINWKALEPAIYPSKPFDINGCWSGSATILPGNRPVIMYTGVDPQNRQVQNVAYPKNLSDPYLREWVKPDFNPVIAPESGVNASAFRDPTTAWRGVGGHWKLVIGSKRDTRGEVILYRSRDFVRWVKAKHSLHTATGTGMWECPDLYPVALRGRLGLDTSTRGGAAVKHVLKVSLDVTRYEYYTVGTYDHVKDRYVPDGASPDGNTGLRYDYGNFYASKTFFDNKKNRRILWGWTNESDSVNDDIAKGWAGIQAIPRAVWLAGNGHQLIQWPVEELESLRSKHIFVQNKQVPSGGFLEVKDIDSSQADVEVTFEVSGLEKAEAFDPSWANDAETLCGRKRADVKGGAGPFGLHVLASANMEEKTAVFFRIFKAEHKYKVLLCHDPTMSSLRPNLYKPTFAGFVDVDIAKTGKISLRTLIDHSVVESFGAGGMTCITSRVYPSLALRRDAHLFAFNNGIAGVKVSTLNAWEMRRPLMNGA